MDTSHSLCSISRMKFVEASVEARLGGSSRNPLAFASPAHNVTEPCCQYLAMSLSDVICRMLFARSLTPFYPDSLLADTLPRSERNSIFVGFIIDYDGAITNLMFLK